MAVILYKKGNQIQVCNEFSYLHLLEEGWFYTPEEALEAVIREKALEAEILEKESEIDLEAEIPEARDSEANIRATAKEAGIGHWHTKSINRLVSELDELKEPEDAERSED